MAKVKNKRNNGLADKVHNKKKTEANKKKINPFEVHINREKIKVLGKKSKHDKGLPGVSRAKAIQKRKETLGTEMKLMNKTNTFIDRRIGEKNSELSAEDRMIARFAAERTKQHSKKNIYNLADDEVLTHRGQTLEQIEKFDDPRSDEEDDEGMGKGFGGLNDNFVAEGHFGGGMLSKTESRDGAKSHKDLIEQLIAESKKRKAEKQKEKEQTLDLTEKLDSEWKDLQPVVFKRQKVEEESLIDKVLSQADQKNADYDKMMRELRFEKRGTPSDGLKNDEKQAKEERLKLEQWEKDLRQRMEGEEVKKTPSTIKHRSAEDLEDNFELEDEKEFMLAYDNEGKPLVPEHILKDYSVPNAKPKFEDGVSDTSDDDDDDDAESDDESDDDNKKVKNSKAKDESSDDDEESNDDDDSESDKGKNTPKKTESILIAIGKDSSDDDDDDEEEESDEDSKLQVKKITELKQKQLVKTEQKPEPKTEKEQKQKQLKAKTEKQQKELNAKTEKEIAKPQVKKPEEKSILFPNGDDNDSNDDDNDDEDSGEESDDDSEEEKPAKDDFDDLKSSDSEEELDPAEEERKIKAFFDKKTMEGDNLKALLTDKSPAQQSVALHKLIKSYDPSLSINNKEHLSRLFAHMLQYTNDIFTRVTGEGELIKSLLTFDRLVPYFYDLAKTNKVSTKKYLIELLIEKRERYKKCPKVIPDLDTLMFFKLVALLYPTSDFKHPVTTPCLIFMSEILTHSRINDAYSVSRGMFLTAIILEFTLLSKRLVPSALNFLRGILYLAASTSIINPIQLVPPFKTNADPKILLLETDCSKMAVVNKMAAKDLVAKEIDDDFRIRTLSIATRMSKEFFDNLSDLEAQECLFEPHIKLIGRIDLENYPKKVNKFVADIVKDMKDSLEVKTYTPLSLDKKRPKALRLYEPDVQDVFTGGKNPKLSREDADRKRLQVKYKKEMKGALREIRRDKAYVASVKIKQKIASDNIRKDKVKQIYKDASIQQGELNQLKRIK